MLTSLDLVRSVWFLLKQEPWAFATLIVFLLGTGFAAARFFYAERLQTLQGRISHRDEEIAALRGRIPENLERHVEHFKADDTQIVLSRSPADVNSITVLLGGVQQPPDIWSIKDRSFRWSPDEIDEIMRLGSIDLSIIYSAKRQ